MQSLFTVIKRPFSAMANLAVGRVVKLLVVLAAVGLFGMYMSNDNLDKEPNAERGDGKYRPILARGDGHIGYLILRSLVLDQDINVDNDLARFGDPWQQRRTKTGRKGVPQPVGPAIVWAPVLTGAHGASKVANALGANIPSHGYTMWHQRIVFATSPLFAFLAGFLGFVVARKKLQCRVGALFAMVAVLFGTSVTYYATYMPSYNHAMDAGLSALFFAYWAVTYGDTRWRRFVLLGVFLGFCMLVRVQALAYGIVVAMEVAIAVVAIRGEHRLQNAGLWVLRGAAVLGVALVLFVPQLLTWKVMFGEYIVSPMGPRYVDLAHPLVSEFLFSSKNGWFSSHPIAYAGIVGLFFVPKGARVIAVGLLLAVATQVWINASVHDWWGNASFGARRTCSLTFVLVIGLAALLRAAALAIQKTRLKDPRIYRTLGGVGLGWFVLWNLGQVHQLRAGRSAGRPSAPSCCAQAAPWQRAIAQPIYNAIGNPFSFPANAAFAIKHGVNLKKWDIAVGNYVDVPDPFFYRDNGNYLHKKNAWNFASPGYERYMLGGFGPPQVVPKTKQRFRWTTGKDAQVIVPLRTPDGQTLTLQVSAGASAQVVELYFNGAQYLTETVSPGRFTELTFSVPESNIRVGTNVLSIRSKIAPINANNSWLPVPPSITEAGVAVGNLQLRYLTP